MNDVVSSVRVRPQTDCPAPLAKQVVLWENSSFTGRCVVLDVGDYAKPVATAFGLRNDSVTSLKLGSEVTSVTLYEDDFFGGRPVVVQGGNGSAVSVANLSDEPYRFNDQTSALKIR